MIKDSFKDEWLDLTFKPSFYNLLCDATSRINESWFDTLESMLELDKLVDQTKNKLLED